MAQTALETMIEKQNWHWRNSMRPVRFFSLDARAALPFFLLLVYARLITLIVTIITTIVFAMLERRGLTFASALRAFRLWLVGNERPAWVSLRRRRMRDFG